MRMTVELLLAAAIGAIAGSFLSTWAVRYERGDTAIRGRSHCDRCGTAVPGWANVPIASYVMLRGRCRACNGAIDRRHPLLEMICMLVAATSVAVHPGLTGWTGAVFGWLLATLAVVDARQFRLPDKIVLPLAALGLMAGAYGVPPPLSDRLWGATGGLVVLTLIAFAYRAVRGRAGLGRGDAKLLAAIGAWIGWQPLPWVVMVAAMVGLLWTAWRIFRGERVTASDKLPLGTLLAIAAWPAWLIVG
jgi:leader peptidase (prepilin peptidase)/N-methyltransferase